MKDEIDVFRVYKMEWIIFFVERVVLTWEEGRSLESLLTLQETVDQTGNIMVTSGTNDHVCRLVTQHERWPLQGPLKLPAAENATQSEVSINRRSRRAKDNAAVFL